jgi:hypothetical protein
MVGETGDSFPDGPVVIVEPELPALPGDCVIVQQRERNDLQATHQGRRHPVSEAFEPGYPIQPPLGSATAIGVVRELTKRVR